MEIYVVFTKFLNLKSVLRQQIYSKIGWRAGIQRFLAIGLSEKLVTIFCFVFSDLSMKLQNL